MKAENHFHVTSSEVVGEALMLMGSCHGVLVVEGDTDASALEDHLADGIVLVIAGGKNNALDAAVLMDARAMGREVAVLVDRDHDGDRGVGSRVIVTNARDLDTELLCSGSTLRAVLKGLGLRTSSVEDHRAQILALAQPASALLSVNESRGLGLPAARLRLASLVQLDGREARVTALVQQVVQAAKIEPSLSHDELSQLVLAELSGMPASLETCQGHYVHQATASLVKKFQAKDVQKMTWIAVQREDFQQTSVGIALAEWGLTIQVEVLRRPTPANAA